MDLDTRKAKAELLTGREVRRLPTSEMECRTTDDAVTFRGLASSTDSPYEMGYFTETIVRGAFDATLAKSPSVQLLVNHEGLPLAATRNGSLLLSATDRGLEFDATCDPTDPDVARIASKVSSGLMSECSFAFRVVNQTWDDDYTQRDITEVSLDRGDVSVVNFGANPNTSVTLRSLLGNPGLTEEQIDELRQDPTVMAVVRRLTSPTAVSVIEAAAGIADAATPITSNLDFYRARAYAHALRK